MDGMTGCFFGIQLVA